MLPVTFGIHKTFLVASTLAARLGPKPVYRNAKCRGGAESSAQAKPSADVPWCREGAHAKRPNSSRIRAHAKQNAPMRSFRKPRTAASFVPKACKTQARKKAAKNGAFATLPHGAETAGNGSEKAKRHYKPSSGKPNVLTAELTSIAFGGPLPKQPNSSKWHAQHQEWNLTWNVQHQNYRPKPLAEHFRNSRAAVARRAFGKNLDSSKLLGALPLSKSKGSADIYDYDF